MAVTASNTIDAVVAYLGVHAAGATAVMLNPRSPRAELAARLQLTGAETVVAGRRRRPTSPTASRSCGPAARGR